eukprot:scaffold12717_cov99-Isochrysis_galbana.AAC.1
MSAVPSAPSIRPGDLPHGRNVVVLWECGSMIVPRGAVGPTTAVGVYKPPHAPERGMGRPPRDMPLRQ